MTVTKINYFTIISTTVTSKQQTTGVCSFAHGRHKVIIHRKTSSLNLVSNVARHFLLLHFQTSLHIVFSLALGEGVYILDTSGAVLGWGPGLSWWDYHLLLQIPPNSIERNAHNYSRPQACRDAQWCLEWAISNLESSVSCVMCFTYITV